MRWFRFDDDVINDPKIQRLSDADYRTWTGLLCLASKGGGVLPSPADIAFQLRMKPPKVAAALRSLTSAGLIDEVDGKLSPHNWNGRQYKSDVSTDRVKRFREAKRNVSSDVAETPPETEQIQTAEKKDAAVAAPDVELYRRAREVIGKDAGGLVKKLLKAKQNSIPLARAAIEQASEKADPRQYIGAILKASDAGNANARPGFGDEWG